MVAEEREEFLEFQFGEIDVFSCLITNILRFFLDMWPLNAEWWKNILSLIKVTLFDLIEIVFTLFC